MAILSAIWGVVRLWAAVEAHGIAGEVVGAVLQVVGAVALFLAIAEGLRLCILIEGNTRGIAPRRGSGTGPGN